MPIKLAKFLGEKKEGNYMHDHYKHEKWIGYNQHHTEASKIMLGLDREEMINIMANNIFCDHKGAVTGEDWEATKTKCIELADALIAKEHEVIVKK